MDFDNAWCPVCDKQIQPKRFTITVPVQQHHPQPPPPSPRKPIKQKQGFVNGTGRLRHNGTIKQPVQLKKRTVIDQGPIPLYCSDGCQLADLSATCSGPPLDPARDEPTPTATPIKRSTYSTTSSETESDDTTSTSSPVPPPPSIAKLAKFYNFPPLPPSPPTFEEFEVPIPPRREYNSGVMMAGRLISSLCPPPAKPHVGPHPPPPETRKPVPGWTDGSNAWRATVYSFSSPQYPQSPDEPNKAYGSFIASPLRAPRSSSSAPPSAPPPPSQRSASDDMIAKFSQSFQRRSEPRASLNPVTPTPTSFTSASPSQSPPRRERSLLPPGMEGKLLVPNVKLKVHSSSTASLSTTWSGTTSSRSPLSVTSDSEEERSMGSPSSLPGYPKRPTMETRSWSYDNFDTYPVMQLPPKKVKQMQKQIVNGEEREVEVEVEVMAERKRLFLFAPSIQVPQ